MEIWFGMGGKHCGKRRKCWLPAFSPFPTMFSKGFFPRVIKSWDCEVTRVKKQQTIMQRQKYFNFFLSGGDKNIVEKGEKNW